MHRETGAYHKKFLGHNQKWLTVVFIFFRINNHLFFLLHHKERSKYDNT